MSINIRTDFMQHAELFGNPVLFTNWLIQRDTIPKDWYCYDLRGTRQSPNVKIALVDKTARYHAGTVLSPTPLKRKETASRRVNSAFHLLGEEMTLEQFCEEHSLEYPQDDRKFAIKAASFDEAALFYAMTPEEDQRLGCIGHVRMDFGHRGQEFWHTWWPRGPEELNSPEFKAELQEVVDELRTSVLKDLAGMTKYCWGHGGEVGGWPANYGYIVETENYRYCLRCNPVPGDYQAYLTAFDLRVQRQNLAEQPAVIGRVSFASGEQVDYTDPEAYLQCIREELPDHPATGFRYETLTDDPAVRKQADDILYDLYGEENPRPVEDYENAPQEGMTMGGISLLQPYFSVRVTIKPWVSAVCLKYLLWYVPPLLQSCVLTISLLYWWHISWSKVHTVYSIGRFSVPAAILISLCPSPLTLQASYKV